MELHQLEYILAVVKYHHFSHAAAEICISQSTLSQQIGKLEEELGIRLFKRTTRTVSLTPAGKEFIAYAANILTEITLAKRAMQEFISVERGQLVIGAIPIIGFLGLTSVIASFQRAYPNLHLEIREDASDQLLEALQTSEIDVALLTPPSNYEQYDDIHFYPLINDDLVLIVNQGHPLSKKRMVELVELKNENHICMKATYGMLRVNLEACHRAGFNPNIVYQSSQVETISALVAEGLGVSLLTSRVAKSLKKASIRIVKIHNAPKRTTALAISQNNNHSPAITAFCKFVFDRFAL
ncbi:LysR family hydrogen peroxide-inducible transcriptional activator [Sporomusaceae bacterium BoRhaA]|uniref:LysR family transcriptional regulator n=1 Tax=Pelorhabdus rhamnosifermentans TaxID=2772457 RepID=UPI001C060DFA|nr:LysR family transcriptional regulator [Pelorhabdus rhamnosifermentans]MBU2703728.1 LysR family hydrogen peroxide-inducible transcriptional activator [Pelorhabdus rhamnosifermentans]